MLQVVEPLWLRSIPHVSLHSCVLLYVFLGTEVFRLLDADLAVKPYYEVVLLPLQICCTIGWGTLPPTRPASQLFCVVYAFFGIPMTFASLANLGRYVVDAYCADWRITRCCKPEGVAKPKTHLPLKGAIYMIIVHQVVGIALYNGIMEHKGVIPSVYFNVITVATIGFGDIVPQPNSMLESLVVIVYVVVGLVVFSTLIVTMCFYYNWFLFVVVRGRLRQWHRDRVRRQRERERADSFSSVHC